MFDFTTGELVKTLTGHTDGLTALAVSLDETLIASVSDDKTARVWNASLGQCVRIFSDGHKRKITCTHFTPDGNRLFTGSEDGNILVSSLCIN